MKSYLYSINYDFMKIFSAFFILVMTVYSTLYIVPDHVFNGKVYETTLDNMSTTIMNSMSSTLVGYRQDLSLGTNSRMWAGSLLRQ